MPFFVKSKKKEPVKIAIHPVIVPKAKLSPAGKFHLFRGGLDDQWYFHLSSRNGKVMFASEGYKQKSMAIKAIKRIQEVAPSATIVNDQA